MMPREELALVKWQLSLRCAMFFSILTPLCSETESFPLKTTTTSRAKIPSRAVRLHYDRQPVTGNNVPKVTQKINYRGLPRITNRSRTRIVQNPGPVMVLLHHAKHAHSTNY